VPKVFIDTNILVYQMDKRDPRKRNVCRDVVKKAASSRDAVISTQVLQEFYVATTTRLHIDPILIKSIMHSLENMEVVTVGNELIDDAIDASLQYHLSFWDSLIIVAAESAKCETLYTEDLNDGQIIRNVRIANPMK